MKNQICMKRELTIDTVEPNHNLINLFSTRSGRLKNIIEVFNVITLKVSPNTDREFARKVKDFYSNEEMKRKIRNTRFCLDMF